MTCDCCLHLPEFCKPIKGWTQYTTPAGKIIGLCPCCVAKYERGEILRVRVPK